MLLSFIRRASWVIINDIRHDILRVWVRSMLSKLYFLILLRYFLDNFQKVLVHRSRSLINLFWWLNLWRFIFLLLRLGSLLWFFKLFMQNNLLIFLDLPIISLDLFHLLLRLFLNLLKRFMQIRFTEYHSSQQFHLVKNKILSKTSNPRSCNSQSLNSFHLLNRFLFPKKLPSFCLHPYERLYFD